MQLPHGAYIAVADGEHLKLFRNAGDEVAPKLTALPAEPTDTDNHASGARHHSSAANPDASQLEEDAFAAGAAALLNKKVLGGQVSALVVIAAPRTLGELRKHYHAKLADVLLKEIAKDLTGHAIPDIEKAISAA